METRNCRYAEYDDNKSNEEYLDWSENLFKEFDRVLVKDGVVLYNISYGNENPTIMWDTVCRILQKTNFMIAESIAWKKSSAFPNNVSHNHLIRIFEYVFVFCRKDEYKTFKTNKRVVSTSKTGQAFYENIFNYVEAPNNDGTNELNNAAYSSSLCEQLLRIYAPNGCTVYDPFMGTGTTGVACKRLGLNCYGSEISAKQVEYALSRINGAKPDDVFSKFSWDDFI